MTTLYLAAEMRTYSATRSVLSRYPQTCTWASWCVLASALVTAVTR